jgi:hypothetical protein
MSPNSYKDYPEWADWDPSKPLPPRRSDMTPEESEAYLEMALLRTTFHHQNPDAFWQGGIGGMLRRLFRND